MSSAKALMACHRADVEVVIYSGRRRAQVMEDARVIGQSAYICEAGCLLVDHGEETLFTGGFVPSEGRTVHRQIAESGAPELLLDGFPRKLEAHDPWHRDREFTHLLRGNVDVGDAADLLARHGIQDVRLVDNGTTRRRSDDLEVDSVHVYHLMPRSAGKAVAVGAHMRSRGISRAETIAVGDSREDLGVADEVGRFFLVGNALEHDREIAALARMRDNVSVTDGSAGDGVYEAVVATLAER